MFICNYHQSIFYSRLIQLRLARGLKSIPADQPWTGCQSFICYQNKKKVKIKSWLSAFLFCFFKSSCSVKAKHWIRGLFTSVWTSAVCLLIVLDAFSCLSNTIMSHTLLLFSYLHLVWSAPPFSLLSLRFDGKTDLKCNFTSERTCRANTCADHLQVYRISINLISFYP